MTPTLAFSLGPIQDAIKSALYGIHHQTGLPWAWTIIVLTLIVRLVLVPLTVKQMRSMQRMQVAAPEIKKLQAKYKHDKQLMQQEMMKFYRENNVNPLGSCLPLVLQLPVFFSLYFVLRQFSRDPPGGAAAVARGDFAFLGSFIHNITLHTNKVGWAGLVLIVAYVASQLGSSILMPNTMPASQRYVFLAMPFIFVVFVYQFPVGLMLYWVTTNLWTVGQQIAIRRLMPMPTPAGDGDAKTAPAASKPSGGTAGGFASLLRGRVSPPPPTKGSNAPSSGKKPPAEKSPHPKQPPASKASNARPPASQQRRVKRPNKPPRR